jgi:hypothetical protein
MGSMKTITKKQVIDNLVKIDEYVHNLYILEGQRTSDFDENWTRQAYESLFDTALTNEIDHWEATGQFRFTRRLGCISIKPQISSFKISLQKLEKRDGA